MKQSKFFAKNNKAWGHKWGFKDSKFIMNADRTVHMTGKRYELSGLILPDLIPFIENIFGIKINPNDKQAEVIDKSIIKPHLNKGFVEGLKSCLPADRYSSSDEERRLHSHGQTSMPEVYRVMHSSLDRLVDMVVYVESAEESQQLLKLAQEYDVCLVPFGGGTNVSCALKLPQQEKRMIVSVDTRRLNKIEWIDKKSRRAHIQAGITGSQLEKQLNAKGYTIGHEPDSIEFSTLGGWISTNASGMKKNRYGNIEDIVENVSMITPSGKIEQTKPITRASIGIAPQNLLFGSEGNLGLITSATLKLHKNPEVKRYNSIVFPNWDLGSKFMYELSGTHYIPAGIRLVDNVQFRFGQF